MEISKAYEPQSVEDKWYQFWLDGKFFVADAKSPKPAYSIVIPPPNVTGVLTLGHVLNNTIQDILARKARMDGKEVLWLPGTDHAGIATQTVVERTLKKEGKIKHRDDLGREKFLEEVWKWKNEKGGIIIQQLKKLGASCDWTRERFTMDPEYSRCVQRVFVDLYKKGLIYRGKRMVNWCPASLTALSDEEVVMKEQKGFLYYFKVEVVDATPSSHSPIGDGGVAATFLTIATTRPETIPGDTAVAVNPKDPRYAHLIGKHVVRPLPVELPREQKIIPIIGDEHVDFEFGTGVLKVTPAHDKADFEIGARHKLAAIEVIAANGQMNDAAGADLRGLDRFKARKVAVEKLTELGALEKEEPYTNNVGYSERADVPIEPRLSEQWFLKYPSVEKARECVEHIESTILEKIVSVVMLSGHELKGNDRAELRKSALKLARDCHWISQTFPNEDTGWKILVRRRSLSHAFSNRNIIAIQAIAVLPELIRTAVLIRSEPHIPAAPDFKAVHHFVGALRFGGEIFQIPMTVKELPNGQLLYDHKAKKITPGGKPLAPHPVGKLGIEPAPDAGLKVRDLLANVNAQKMQFHPQRWAKVYDHWMGGLQDWCISRQLWWGHRIPVWSKKANADGPGFAALQTQLNTFKQNGALIHMNLYTPHARNEGATNVLQHDPQENYFIRLDVAVDPTEVKIVSLLEQNGFTQDPDVLDTWFSSWLWPFATMGWPEQTDTLKKFYPTTDLVTGPDIIFFWVARMIMAGYEFMGELPFQNVYFTGIIRDKQGRKMSKSLGNSPDPLDLIAKFGADALRFGVMRAAPLGQDILFDEQNVELGRNFCNKLWNACRFRQMVGGGDASSPNGPKRDEGVAATYEVQGEIEPTLLSSDDKWILLKLDAAIREVTIALNEYKFSDATAALYRFFWSEYCDWYVEASKAVLSSRSRGDETQTEKPGTDQSLLTSSPTKVDEAKKANTLAVIDFVLSHTLRMFHPFLPFITEELWHGMGYATDMPDNQGGKTIMFAPWPMPLDEDFKGHYGLDDCYLKIAGLKYELVSQGRNLRREANISTAKKIRYVLKPLNNLPPHDIEVIRLLLNAEAVEVDENYQPAKGTLMARTELGELFLPLEGLRSPEELAAEKARLTKELEKYDAEISKVEQKLANPNFTQKVPPQVLQEHQQRLAEWRAKRAAVKAALDALG